MIKSKNCIIAFFHDCDLEYSRRILEFPQRLSGRKLFVTGSTEVWIFPTHKLEDSLQLEENLEEAWKDYIGSESRPAYFETFSSFRTLAASLTSELELLKTDYDFS